MRLAEIGRESIKGELCVAMAVLETPALGNWYCFNGADSRLTAAPAGSACVESNLPTPMLLSGGQGDSMTK